MTTPEPMHPPASRARSGTAGRTSLNTIRVVFFGASGAFSRPPLEALLRAGFDVRAVVVSALPGTTASGAPPVMILPARPASPARRRALPLLAPAATDSTNSIMRLATKRGIPVLEVARLRDPRTLDALAVYQPDVICVACFSRRLPGAVLRLPRLGCLNVHPSLLPANRGPDPLFWTFQRGKAETGVTIHLMDEGLDTGRILRQRRIPVPDGRTERELEDACAQAGGELLATSVAELASGSALPVPQDEALATAYPWPAPEDYTITSHRPARWAYNFASGLLARGEPILVRVAGMAFRVLAPLEVDSGATLDAPYRVQGEVLALRCAPGVFTCRAQRM